MKKTRFPNFNADAFEEWTYLESQRLSVAEDAALAAGDKEKAARLGAELVALGRVMGAFWRFNQ